MVALARTMYTLADRDLNELVDLAQTGGQAAVERHRLDGFIPAAYTNPPPAPGISSTTPTAAGYSDKPAPSTSFRPMPDSKTTSPQPARTPQPLPMS